ncbi:hypothetical protein HK098_000032 [Nowakowskiella sp. JEL0407]|nr:hypothetical protein HK098_000032 [Nowakowskiella sp. JEL0407]
MSNNKIGPHPVSISSSISNISKTTNPSSKPNLLKIDPDAMEIVTNNTSIELKEKKSQKDASNSSLNGLNTSVGQESEQSASPKIRNRSYSTPVKPNLPQEPTLPSHNRTNTTPIPPKELLSQHRKTLSSISPDQIPNNGSPRVTRHSSASTASFNPVLWMLSSVSPSPTAMTLAEFKRTDYNPRQQRIVFFALQKQMEAQTRGIKKKTGDRKRESSAKRNKPSTLPKWGSFLSKKRKKKTTAGTFHSISMAIHDNRISFVCSLLDDLSQTDLQKKETEARKIFLHAMANGMENVCMVMLERGFPQNVNNSFTHRGDRFVFPSFFLLAVGLGLDNVVRAMIKQKCNVNHSWYDITATHLASCKGNIGILQLLLENGGEVTAKLPLCRYMLLKKLKSQKSKNALKKLGIGNQIIPQNGSEDASGLALSLNDDYAVKRDLLPLDLAAACGNGDVVKYILSKMTQKAISSSYFCLLVQRDLQITMNLVKAGANIEQTDQFNSTPLHLASRTGSLDIVVVLLSKGANINARGQNGWTPIHEALSQRRLPVAQYLCSRGADLNIKTNSNKNAWEMGEEFGLSADELKEYLTSPLDQKIQDRIQLVSNAFTHLQPISTFEENNRAVQNEGYNPQPNMKLRRKATVSGMNLRNSFIEKERFHPNDESDLPPLDLPPMVNVDESFEKYEMKAGNSKWKEKMSALGGLKGIKKALNGNK